MCALVSVIGLTRSSQGTIPRSTRVLQCPPFRHNRRPQASPHPSNPVSPLPPLSQPFRAAVSDFPRPTRLLLLTCHDQPRLSPSKNTPRRSPFLTQRTSRLTSPPQQGVSSCLRPFPPRPTFRLSKNVSQPHSVISSDPRTHHP